MEASALPAPAAIARNRLSIGSSLLRLRSDEQLVALFRAGNEDAFRIIHERYHQRLFAYARQMLPGSRQDAEDALQDIFVRAYAGLRASDRALALRAWLYRVAHNRCVDELRRPAPPSPELLEVVRPPAHDPIAEAERRESLRALIDDIRRLPDQQRSALLMRELGGMAYADLAVALGVSLPAVKSLLVRARIGLAQSAEARDTACFEIRHELVVAHDRGVRPSGLVRRHLHDCDSCRAFRAQMRSTSRQLAAIVPLGPLGLIANLFGFGSGAAGGGGAAGSGAAAAGGVLGTGGAVGAIGAVAGGAATHVAIIAAAVVTAGGAVEIQHTISASTSQPTEAIAPAALKSPPPFTPADPLSTGASALGREAWPSSGQTFQSLTASQAAAANAAIAGPALPAADQVNPADAAAAAGSSLASGDPSSPPATSVVTGLSSGASTPGAGQPATGSATGSTAAGATSSPPSGSAGIPDGGGGASAPTTASTSDATSASTDSSSSSNEKSTGALATPASASSSPDGAPPAPPVPPPS